MSRSFEARLAGSLASRRDRGLLRSLDAPATDGLVDFSSNDYLSLSKSLELRRRLIERLERNPSSPFGPPSSRLLDGNSNEHRALEGRLATVRPSRCRHR